MIDHILFTKTQKLTQMIIQTINYQLGIIMMEHSSVILKQPFSIKISATIKALRAWTCGLVVFMPWQVYIE